MTGQDYLPREATVPEACAWLQAHIGGNWTLARLIENGLRPWFWLGRTPGWPDDIFGKGNAGYLAPVLLEEDIRRLAVDGRETAVHMTRTYDGKLMKVEPANIFRIPVEELRFLRDDIQELVSEHMSEASRAVNSKNGNDSIVEDKPETEIAWIDEARGLALEYIQRHRSQHLFPTQTDVCNHLEKELRARKIYGAQSRPLSASYIGRNAIQGQWWKVNKP